MILDGLKLVLWPLISAINFVFDQLNNLTGSAGFSIILLSILVSLLILPLQKRAKRTENRIIRKKETVDAQLADEAAGLKGEEKFRVMERVFEANRYHPIQTIALGLPLFVSLPFLLSALFAFSENPAFQHTQFLFVRDLSMPDAVLFGLNLLPIFMFGITMLDAIVRFKNNRQAIIRFLIISVLLFFLIYNFSAAIVLYWTSSNVVSFLLSLISSGGRSR